MLRSTSEKNLSKIWHSKTDTWKAFRMAFTPYCVVCLGPLLNTPVASPSVFVPKNIHWRVNKKMFISLIVSFNCLSVVHSNFRLIVYNLMTMCCAYQMQILQSLQAAFHLKENVIWKGELWFKSRGQFWQLMSWWKWTEMSSWGTLFFF